MMIPTGAREPKFGTNPIAWAAPSGTSGEAPFLFDVAVSNVAGNKIGLAKRVGLEDRFNSLSEKSVLGMNSFYVNDTI